MDGPVGGMTTPLPPSWYGKYNIGNLYLHHLPVAQDWLCSRRSQSKALLTITLRSSKRGCQLQPLLQPGGIGHQRRRIAGAPGAFADRDLAGR